jgi:hypothetical protein
MLDVAQPQSIWIFRPRISRPTGHAKVQLLVSTSASFIDLPLRG